MAAGGVRAVHLLTGRLLMSETRSAPVTGRTTTSFLWPPSDCREGGEPSLGNFALGNFALGDFSLGDFSLDPASGDLGKPLAADTAVARRIPQLDTIERTCHDDPRIQFQPRVFAQLLVDVDAPLGV